MVTLQNRILKHNEKRLELDAFNIFDYLNFDDKLTIIKNNVKETFNPKKNIKLDDDGNVSLSLYSYISHGEGYISSVSIAIRVNINYESISLFEAEFKKDSYYREKATVDIKDSNLYVNGNSNMISIKSLNEIDKKINICKDAWREILSSITPFISDFLLGKNDTYNDFSTLSNNYSSDRKELDSFISKNFKEKDIYDFIFKGLDKRIHLLTEIYEYKVSTFSHIDFRKISNYSYAFIVNISFRKSNYSSEDITIGDIVFLYDKDDDLDSNIVFKHSLLKNNKYINNKNSLSRWGNKTLKQFMLKKFDELLKKEVVIDDKKRDS